MTSRFWNVRDEFSFFRTQLLAPEINHCTRNVRSGTKRRSLESILYNATRLTPSMLIARIKDGRYTVNEVWSSGCAFFIIARSNLKTRAIAAFSWTGIAASISSIWSKNDHNEVQSPSTRLLGTFINSVSIFVP